MARKKYNKSGIYKRKGSPYWQYRCPISNIRRSTGTTNEGQAKALVAKITIDAFNGSLGKKPQITLNGLLARFMNEHAQYLKTFQKVDHHCELLLSFFGDDTLINDITLSDVSLYKAARKAIKPRRGEVLSNTTINRELETLRSALNQGQLWGYQPADINFKNVMLKEPDARIRYLTPKQIQQLLETCNPLIRDAIEFAIYTGLRAGNIFGLKWENINSFTKEIVIQIKSNIPNGKTFRLPISKPMQTILSRQSKGGYVFKNSQGGKITRYDKYFQQVKRDLLKETGSNFWKDLRFHDLRHHAATQLRVNGAPIEVVQQILGHTNISTTMKYAHIRKDEIVKAMNNIAQIRHNRKSK